MLQDLLYILIALACGCVMLFVSQQGLLRSITFCFTLSITFALVLAFALALPIPLIAVAALLFTALLAWLGRCEHTEPDADQDTERPAATDHKQEPYTGLLHPTVTEALRRRMATSE